MAKLNFKRDRYPGDIIIMTVRWYLRYKLSLEDIIELLMERGIEVSRHGSAEIHKKA
jgi:transposase-like protein